MYPLPRQIWSEVISLYKNMPFLWDKKDPKYTSKHARETGFKIILKKYKEYDKNATLPMIKKKIDNMRTSYRRELKKVLASRRHTSDTEDMYVPELWYFDLLGFLNDHIILFSYKPCSDEEDNDDDTTSGLQTYVDDSSNINEMPLQQYLLVENKKVCNSTKKRKKIKIEIGESSQLASEKDDWLVVGKSIGIQLRNLDNDQAVIAQKLISDAIFYAKLRRLTEDSCVMLHHSNDEYLEE